MVSGLMWSELLQCSQLLLSTTIFATPITMKNHNCRNRNHNRRNLINQICRNCNHNCRNFFENEIDLVNVYLRLKDDFSLSVTTLTIFFTTLSLFCPVNLPQYICSHIIAERKSGHFLCKAYCFITIFAVSFAKRKHSKIKFACKLTENMWQDFATEDAAHCRMQKYDDNYTAE